MIYYFQTWLTECTVCNKLFKKFIYLQFLSILDGIKKQTSYTDGLC